MENAEVGEVEPEADEAENGSEKPEAVVRGERLSARAGEEQSAVQIKRLVIRILRIDISGPDWKNGRTA